MDDSELKKDGNDNSSKPDDSKPDDSKPDKSKPDKSKTDDSGDDDRSARPDPASNLKEAHPGTPLGVAKHHIYTHARHALKGAEAIQAAYVHLDLPDPLKKRVLGFLGNFGSGKTEVAVNLAIQLGLAAKQKDDPFTGPVCLMDLDIVNPYFRSREAIEPLENAGVEVIAPTGENFWADLPIILPEVRGRLKQSDGTLILDVGGDDLGAKVLSHMKDDFLPDDYTLIMVVNANRPFTSEIEGARKVLDELEEAAGLKIGGLISNTHLMDETDPDEIRRGYEFTRKMSEQTGIPLLMVTAESRLMDDGSGKGIKKDEFDCLLLPLYRFMLPPWRQSEVRGRAGGESRAIGQNDSHDA